MSDERDIRLRIAKNLHDGLSAKAIQAGFKTSGVDVDENAIGQVRRLMRKGLIKIDEDGEAFYPEEVMEGDIEAFLSGAPPRKKAKPPGEASDEVSSEVIRKETVAMTKEEMEQIIILGKACQQAYFSHAAKKGLNINEMRKHPIHKIVLQALRDSDELPKFRGRIEELETTLSFYQARADPFWRMERGIELLKDFIELALYYEMLGMDISESDISQFYAKQINRFLVSG